MSETAEAVGLSKQDIAALRLADEVYAHLHEGRHYLSAHKRVTLAQREQDPFRQDQRIEVTVEGFTRHYKDNDHMEAGFTSVWSASGIWQIVRPGDRIRLVWHKGGHTNETMREVGLVGDSLSIEVIRKGDVNGRKPLQFLAASSAGLNNSARMCR